ncbi:hypothetical protein ACHAW5_003401 [Stephanodiscus triporus]|uniref:Uncharacterized protein n=1 Tax=Stephanodiscus triporus TaxID=2934178 RepID=A0ABD3NS86_9STRA
MFRGQEMIGYFALRLPNSGSHEKYDQPTLEWASFMKDPFVLAVYFDMIGSATWIVVRLSNDSAHTTN